ncbi:MAG: hypothetical protein WAM60_08610 [Candidatus Promineifilaceae bacterium]
MSNNPNVSLEAFLNAPIEEVAKVAPTTMVYSVSGSRRSAALAGLPTSGDVYFRWSWERMMRSLEMIFHHGVRHILYPIVTPSQFNESTPEYREHLWDWLDWGLAGEEALAEFKRNGWRVYVPFGEKFPSLHQVNERLRVTQTTTDSPGLWFFIIPEHNLLWEWVLELLQQSKVTTVEGAIRQIYGQDIPPATLYLDFGKPIVTPDLLPPFLIGVLQCYWSQRPGYLLDQQQLRSILYDYAYIRPTWQPDKTGRAEEAVAHREDWERGPTLGLGTRKGPFWYPAAFPES